MVIPTMADSLSPAELVRRILAAYERADLAPLLDLIDEDIVWKSAFGADSGVRFGGEYRGRAGVLEAVSQLAMSVVFRRFRPREMVSEGEIVWCLVDAEIAPIRAPHRGVRRDAAVRCRIHDGRILEIQTFFDTAALRDRVQSAAQPRPVEPVS